MKVEDQQINSSGVQDLASNTHGLEVGDPIVYQLNGKRIVGSVNDLYLDNGVTKVEILLRDKSKHNVKANDALLNPLFMRNKETQIKTFTRFSYNEVINLVNSNKFNNLEYDQIGKTNFNNLMLGGSTQVIDNIQLTKKGNEKSNPETYNVSGRYKVYESNGELKVNLETKARELNLNNPVLGLSLNEDQKKQLMDTGELGLVDNFVNTKTGEVTKKWVSLDIQLNKIVTRPEKSIFIDKMYGRDLSQNEKETLQRGEGLLLEFNKNNGEKFKQFIKVSAASTKLNGLKAYSEETAKKLNLIQMPEDHSKKKSKSVKI